MSCNTKIVLGILVGVLLLCVCVVGVVTLVGVITARGIVNTVQENTNREPAQVDEAAAKIADYETPEGFSPEFSMDIGGVNWVYYNGPQTDSHLILMQFPDSMHVDPEIMERQFRDLDLPGGEKLPITDLGTRQVTIRGQDVTVKISEAVSGESGEVFHSEMAIFQGKGGQVLVSINMPESMGSGCRGCFLCLHPLIADGHEPGHADAPAASVE